MRAGPQAWRTYGDALKQTAGELAGTRSAVTGLPESDKMVAAINQLGLGMVDIGGQCHQVADALNSFAGKVESTQNTVRDLLNHLSPMGLAGLAFSAFRDGDPLGAIKAVAHDIDVLLGHVRDEADAAGRQFERGLGVIDSAADGLQRWISREFPVVAPVANGFIDIEVGVFHSAAPAVQGAEELSPSRFLYDPKGAGKAWTGAALAAGMLAPPAAALLAATYPSEAVTLGNRLIAYDDWNSDHPLRGLGRNIGDVAQFFIPGAGETKPAVTAAETSARASEAGAGLESALGATVRDGSGLLGRVGEVGGEIGSQAGKAAADLDRIPATTVEPPRPPSGPEPPQRGAMPTEHPDGLGPPSRPGMPAAEVKPTAVEAPVERPAVHEPPPEPAPAARAPREPSSAPHTEPRLETHIPTHPLEAPLDESPAAAHPIEHAPGDPASSLVRTWCRSGRV